MLQEDQMANFEVYGKYDIAQEGMTVGKVSEMLKQSLSNYYDEDDITVTPTGVVVKGNLKSFWERAITKAEAKVKIQENQLVYRVNGESCLGGWPWVWFFLGFFTGFFFFWFAWDLVEFLINRDRPKRYFEEAFKSVRFDIG
jgi:hypothetical protein